MTERPHSTKSAVENHALSPPTLGKVTVQINAVAHHQAADRQGRKRFRAPHLPDLNTLDWGRTYLPAYFSQPASKLHQWLGAKLDRCQTYRGTKINLVGPRGAAKSTIATLTYVLQCAVEGWEPYIWIVSDTKHQAHLHLENVKSELLENERLASDYPRATGRGPLWTKDRIQLRNAVLIESLGTGQSMRGQRFRAHRPTLIVCDDLQNDSHISSAAQRESSRVWFQGTLLKAGARCTNIVNLATALHREALAMELLKAPGWTSKLFRAIESWPTQMHLWEEWEAIYCDVDNPSAKRAAIDFFQKYRDEMEAGAKLLWPDVEDLYTLMRMRVESGRTAFEREKQGSPVDPESCEFPESYFEEHIWFDDWPAEFAVKAIALDPSKGADARRGDYSAYVMLGIDPTGTMFIEADLARRPTPQMVADGAALYRRFLPQSFGVEANQYQELLAGEIAAEFERQGLPRIAPATIHNQVNKQVRIRRLGPYLSMQRLRFKRGSASTKLLVEQLRDFPAGAHDDGPDALEMALRLAEDVWLGRNADDGLGDRLPVG
jgi:predicted phage terminase large subunit-like protein